MLTDPIALLWLLPGLLLGCHLRRGRPRDEALLAATPLGFALPVLYLPLARALGLPFQAPWLALSLAALPLLVARLARGHAGAPWLWLGAVAAGVVGCALPLLALPAPPGVDMAMHLSFARLIANAGRIPLTQAPLYPGVPLGLYPLGFHGLVALTAAAGPGLARAGLLVTAATHAFVPLAAYLAVKRRGRDLSAAAAALLAAWICRNPQAYVGWGGNPAVLGGALAWVALRRLLDGDEAAPRRGGLETGLLLAAVPLVHPTPAAALPYLAALAAVPFARAGRLRPDRARLTHAAIAVVVAALLLAPLLTVPGGGAISAAERTWVRDHQRQPPQAPAPGAAGLHRYLVGMYGDPMLLLFMAAVAAGLATRRRGGERAAPWLVPGLAALTLLAWLAARWLLPPALALYPERLMALGLPLFALALRDLIDAVAARPAPTPPSGRTAAAWRRAPIAALLLGLALLAATQHRQYFVRGARDGSLVTPADLAAMDWLRAHTPPGALIDANYGDAGAWLPALAGRATTRPQINPVWFEEVEASLADRPVAARLRGARRRFGADEVGTRLRPGDLLFTAASSGDTALVARAAGERGADLVRLR